MLASVQGPLETYCCCWCDTLRHCGWVSHKDVNHLPCPPPPPCYLRDSLKFSTKNDWIRCMTVLHDMTWQNELHDADYQFSSLPYEMLMYNRLSRGPFQHHLWCAQAHTEQEEGGWGPGSHRPVQAGCTAHPPISNWSIGAPALQISGTESKPNFCSSTSILWGVWYCIFKSKIWIDLKHLKTSNNQ